MILFIIYFTVTIVTGSLKIPLKILCAFSSLIDVSQCSPNPLPALLIIHTWKWFPSGSVMSQATASVWLMV